MVLITGAAGQLGTAFRSLLPHATFLTRSDLDLAEPRNVAGVLDHHRPDVVINCAAYTNVDAAESDEDRALRVNGESVGEMARWTAANNARLITFSTDYVFAGTQPGAYLESSPTGPVSAYGRTKLAGERAALAADLGSLVIRTSWVISGTHSNFVATILKLVRAQSVRVVDDQHGRPTVADDLARSTLAAIDGRATGILHLSNQGATTWFELAQAAVEAAGLDPDLVTPCSTDEFPRPAPRPANSVLASERLDELGLKPLPHWRASLPDVVKALLAET